MNHVQRIARTNAALAKRCFFALREHVALMHQSTRYSLFSEMRARRSASVNVEQQHVIQRFLPPNMNHDSLVQSFQNVEAPVDLAHPQHHHSVPFGIGVDRSLG